MKTFPVYPLFNIEPVRAEGSFLWDNSGIQYLDLYGGHAVISIGHTHPHYVKKLTDQLNNIAFYSNSVQIPLQEELAEKLGVLSGYPDFSLFLCNSGAEANENAFKLASFFTGKSRIISFSKGFHGRTSLAVAATDNLSIQAPVNKTPFTTILSFNDLQALEDNFDNTVAAVIVEGIQGVGGIYVPSAAFLQKIKNLCEKHGALMILDEVQSGYGRTGKFFAHQLVNVKPDIITTAKGMGNGFPIAGVLIKPEIKAISGMLGTTFGGNHLACAAGIAVLDVIKNENLLDNAARMGDYLIKELKDKKGIRDIRGAGLMLGIELETSCAEVRKTLLTDFRIFTGSSSDKNTIRILPALNVGRAEIDTFLKAFDQILTAISV